MKREVLLPQVELNMESVKVVRWLVAPGDRVNAEQPILEVETQKSLIEVPAPASGYIRVLAVKEGDEIGEKALLCLMTDSADEEYETRSQKSGVRSQKVESGMAHIEQAAAESEINPIVQGVAVKTKIIPAAPAARKLAKELGVDLGHINGTGPNGRVKVEDVRRAAENGEREGAIPARGEWVSIPPARRELIRQMTRALSEIPQFHIARQMDVTPLTKQEPGVTFTHRLIKAAAGALRNHESLRTMINGDRIKVEPVSVAVAMETPSGLLAPVIRNADRLSLTQIVDALNALRRRGEGNSLERADLADGPFAITNLRMFGVDFFQPFVFSGQTAVLAVGRAVDAPAGRKVAWFNLAADHRVVDGAEAARFLETLQQEILRA